MNRRLWLLGLLAFLAAPVSAEEPHPVFDRPLAASETRRAAFAELAGSLRAQSRVEARFTQTQHIQALARPITSSGRMLLSEEDGFVWQIEEPFALRYRFADDELWREEEGERERIEPADQPGLYGFFAFFGELFQLTEANLEQRFELYFDPGESGWTLGLEPDSARLRRMMSRLVVEGSGARIERARLVESSGDRTELRFDYPEADGQ